MIEVLGSKYRDQPAMQKETRELGQDGLELINVPLGASGLLALTADFLCYWIWFSQGYAALLCCPTIEAEGSGVGRHSSSFLWFFFQPCIFMGFLNTIFSRLPYVKFYMN